LFRIIVDVVRKILIAIVVELIAWEVYVFINILIEALVDAV